MVYLESPQLDSLASAWTGRKLPGICFYYYSLYEVDLCRIYNKELVIH